MIGKQLHQMKITIGLNNVAKLFAQFYPLGSQDARAGSTDDTIFRLYSRGYATGRDAYIYNFSHDACAENARRMVARLSTQHFLNLKENPEFQQRMASADTCRKYFVGWRSQEQSKAKRNQPNLTIDYIRKVAYRPFVKTNCYADYIFIQMKYQMHRIFPNSSSENRVICVPGIGSQKPFSALMTNIMPDLGFNECLPMFPAVAIPSNLQTDQTRQASFKVLTKHQNVLTTFPTQHCVPSESITAITPSPKTTSSITSTGSYTHRVTENSSQTIYPR